MNKWDLVTEDQVSGLERALERRLRFLHEPVIRRVSALTGQGVGRLLPAALELHAEATREVATHDVNQLLGEAVKRLPPPVGNRRRARLYYATQVSQHPFTVLVFASNPDYIPENYRRYLESFFRKRLGIRSSPVRVRFRPRREPDEDAE
jgi:GTP-binding protein